MAGDSTGTLFRVTTAGESHGPGIVVIVEGCPPGLALTEADLQVELNRRRPGQSPYTTPRDEKDQVTILSGVFQGRTTGTPVAMVIANENRRSADYSQIRDLFRPGHADHTYLAKYGIRDYRGGGRASARETATRVAAGAIAQKILSLKGIHVVGWVSAIGDVQTDTTDPQSVTRDQVDATPVRCPDPRTAARMMSLIDAVREQEDSIGGHAEFMVHGVPAGLGEPVFDKLKADLAKAMMSIPAVMAFEYGVGTLAGQLRGSEMNDPYTQTRGRIHPATNRHGGMLGGISSGNPLHLRITVKPASSIQKTQHTVDRDGQARTISTRGRHDPCILPRVIPVGEAMIAITLVDHFMRWHAQCHWLPETNFNP